MPTIAITGGIASGKTAFRKYLSFQWNAESFDADAVATELAEHSETVRQEIKEAFGPAAYRNDQLDRERIRARIFSNPDDRKKLENILHPRIRERWTKLAQNYRQRRAKLLVEIPLLYETGGEEFCDFVISVTCPPGTQMQRISCFRGMDEAFAQKIIDSQISFNERMDRADQVIWNDGPEDLLREQAKLTADYLTQRYGL